MTVTAPSMPLFARVQTPRPAAANARLRPGTAEDDAEARQLAAAISRGDEIAFRHLYDRYQRRLFCLALVLARGDEACAHDAVQATFVIAAQKLRGADSAGHLWNWLARVARQQSAKIWKERNRQTAVVEVSELPDDVAAGRPDARLEESLDAALRSLADDERKIIEGFYFDGLSHREIAERLQTTPKAVSSRLERARTKLRSAIAAKLSHET